MPQTEQRSALFIGARRQRRKSLSLRQDKGRAVMPVPCLVVTTFERDLKYTKSEDKRPRLPCIPLNYDL